MIWVVASVLAAFFQTIRTALQKHLTTDMPTTTINWVRYGFGLPFIVLYMSLLIVYFGYSFPALNLLFIFYCLGASITQIVGTHFLISLFSERHFAIGTTYAKTETLLTAVFGFILFGEKLALLAWIAVIIGMVGVMCISITDDKITLKKLLTALASRSALKGLLAGCGFSLAGLCIRQATLHLEAPIFINAGTTLLVVMTLQLIILGCWILYNNTACFAQLRRQWQPCLAIGLTSTLGSIGWFTAFALAQAAYVKMVGNIELLFCLLITHYIFHDPIKKIEIAGIYLITGGIILLLLSV